MGMRPGDSAALSLGIIQPADLGDRFSSGILGLKCSVGGGRLQE